MPHKHPRTVKLRDLLARRVKAFFRPLPGALSGDQESIHRLRVAGRRLRIALPVLADKPGGRRVQRADRMLKELIGKAGLCRDLDVASELLAPGPGPGEDRRALSRRMRATRALTRHRMTEALLDYDVARLRRRLRELLSRAGHDREEAGARLRASAAALFTEVSRLRADMADRYLPVSQHRMRTRLRRVRYLLELDRELSGDPDPSGVDPRSAAVDRLQSVQGALGLLHDTHVLAEWLNSQSLRGGPLGPAARRLSEGFRRRSRRAHRAWLASSPDRVIRSSRAALSEGPAGREPDAGTRQPRAAQEPAPGRGASSGAKASST